MIKADQGKPKEGKESQGKTQELVPLVYMLWCPINKQGWKLQYICRVFGLDTCRYCVSYEHWLVDSEGLAFLMPCILSGSYTLSTTFSMCFSNIWGNWFDGDTLFRVVVQRTLSVLCLTEVFCIYFHLLLEKVSFMMTEHGTDLWV